MSDNHPPCPCGEELADECMCPRAPVLGSMRIEPAIGSRTESLHHGQHRGDCVQCDAYLDFYGLRQGVQW